MNSPRTPLLCFALTGVLVGLGCGPLGPVAENLDPLREEMAHDALALDPVQATLHGYHEHTTGGEGEEGGTTVSLDGKFGDYSAAGIQARLDLYNSIGERMAPGGPAEVIERDKMKGERWVDYAAMEERIARTNFRWTKEQPHVHNPSFYVELAGIGLSTPLVSEYASEGERAGHVVSRLQNLPGLLDQAKGNLTSSSELQIEAGVAGTSGLINLINNDLTEFAGSASGFEAASAAAVEALEAFRGFLQNDLSSADDWRMTDPLYTEKIEAETSVDVDLTEVLSQLQTEFDDTYKLLIETAVPIHRKIYGGQRAPSDFALMRDILDVVSDENRLRDGSGLVSRTEENIEKVKEFMQQEDVVETPSTPLEIGSTPPFLRAANPVTAFLAPPTLSPDEGAQYWITPIPGNWSRGQTLAKLREYNNYKLQVVALEGYARYVASVLTAEVENPVSRLLRNVDPNQGYMRGWNWYLTDYSIELRYGQGSPEFKLNWYKYKLEVLASAILDIKLHTQGMSTGDAAEMLRRQVFMEAGAVDSAVRNIQLNPTVAATTFIGSKEWLKIRQEYQDDTTDFSLTSFHGKALRVGPLPAHEVAYIAIAAQRQ